MDEAIKILLMGIREDMNGIRLDIKELRKEMKEGFDTMDGRVRGVEIWRWKEAGALVVLITAISIVLKYIF